MSRPGRSDGEWTDAENQRQWEIERKEAEPKRYRVTGVIEVYIKAVDPESARAAAEASVYKVFDGHGRRLGAVVSLDNVTWPDSQENLL